jgi:hypothetical protein
MAVSHKWFSRAQEGVYLAVADRKIDWVNDTIQTTLHTATYVPDQDVHDFFNDATNEITGTGYTAGGVALSGKAVTYDTGTNEVRLDANDAAWTGASFTARIAVNWKQTAGASTTDPLLTFVDFGADESVASGNFSVQWDATGLAKIVVS